MRLTYSNVIITLIFLLYFVNLAKAQPQKGKSIDISIGYGLTVCFYNSELQIDNSVSLFL